MADGRRMLTVEEVADLTDRDAHILRRWIRDGSLPATRVPRHGLTPAQYLVDPCDLPALLGRRRWHLRDAGTSVE